MAFLAVNEGQTPLSVCPPIDDEYCNLSDGQRSRNVFQIDLLSDLSE